MGLLTGHDQLANLECIQPLCTFIFNSKLATDFYESSSKNECQIFFASHSPQPILSH